MAIQDTLVHNKKQVKSALIYTLVAILAFCYGYFYLFDQYAVLFSQGSEIQNIASQIDKTKQSGIESSKLKEVLVRSVKDTKQVDAFFSDKDKLEEAIKKPASVTASYDDWLLSEAGKASQLDSEVKRNSDIIGNILPTFAEQNIANADIKEVDNLINFKSFIEYIEFNLLKKYQLESYSSVGLSNVTFDKEGKKSSDIGSFKVMLDIKGTNANIKSFLNAIQASGKLSIQDGKLVSPVQIQEDGRYSGLSNLLMKVDDSRFDMTLDNDSVTNKWSITLRFFVRGIGSQEFVLLRSGLVTKYQSLQKTINTYSDCKNLSPVVCADTEGSRSVGAIKSLSRDIAALKVQLDDVKSTNANTDIGAQLDKALTFNASLRVIEKNLQDNIAVINNLTKTWAK